MKHLIMIWACCWSLLACSPKQPNDGFAADQAAGVAEGVSESTGTQADDAAQLVAAPPPPETARTPEALDTTTLEQRTKAAAEPANSSKVLGRTIASLGSPTEPGFWLKTPLVKVESKGRVTNLTNALSAAVVLIPIDGPDTAGSRMSLPAMRLIEASLTELTEVEVALDG